MTIMLRHVPPLARSTHHPEMTPVVPPHPLLLPAIGGVAVPVIYDDAFFDDLGASLPDCSLLYVIRAASWSARHSKSGFVPNWKLAELTDNPDLVKRTLRAAGLIYRADGGWRFAEGRGITIVNANEAEIRAKAEAEAAAVAEEKAAAKREADKLRQRRSRDNRKAARAEVFNAGVKDVTRDMASTSHVTTCDAIEGSDLDQSIGVGHIDARAREAPDPALVTLVADLAEKKAKRIVSAAEACRAIAVWEKRAEDSGNVIHDRPRFYGTCAKRERDIEKILAPPPNPLWVELGTAPEPVPGSHPYQPDPSPFVDACAKPGCGLREKNARHTNQEANTG